MSPCRGGKSLPIGGQTIDGTKKSRGRAQRISGGLFEFNYSPSSHLGAVEEVNLQNMRGYQRGGELPNSKENSNSSQMVS